MATPVPVDIVFGAGRVLVWSEEGIDIAVHLLDVHKGHGTFQMSKALTRIYYIIEGAGVFTINNQNYDVVPDLLVEVPPRCRILLFRVNEDRHGFIPALVRGKRPDDENESGRSE